jgi:hypothetical protein
MSSAEESDVKIAWVILGHRLVHDVHSLEVSHQASDLIIKAQRLPLYRDF